MLLVSRVVDARDHLRHAVLLLRDLADDDVVLVVAGDGDHQVGALDAGPLEHEQLGRVARPHDVLEALLEQRVALAVALDQRHLVAHVHERGREVAAHLAAPDDQDVHG